MTTIDEHIALCRESEKGRTQGEWVSMSGHIEDEHGDVVADLTGYDDSNHIVNAVNACAPMMDEIERLREREVARRSCVKELRTQLANVEALKETVALEREENETLRARVAELNKRTGSRCYESWACPRCGRHRVQVPHSYRPEFSTPENESQLRELPECEKCHWRPGE